MKRHIPSLAVLAFGLSACVQTSNGPAPSSTGTSSAIGTGGPQPMVGPALTGMNGWIPGGEYDGGSWGTVRLASGTDINGSYTGTYSGQPGWVRLTLVDPATGSWRGGWGETAAARQGDLVATTTDGGAHITGNWYVGAAGYYNRPLPTQGGTFAWTRR